MEKGKLRLHAGILPHISLTMTFRLSIPLLFLVFTGCGKSVQDTGLVRSNPRETIESKAAPPTAAPPGMQWIPGGSFTMGSDARPVEKPAHHVVLEGFWMDGTEVTNAQFRAFVEATGYISSAEKTPKKEDFPPEIRPQLDESMLQPGANNFRPTPEPVPLDNELAWWEYMKGASWRKPFGPEGAGAEENNPVVCVNWADASSYAKWAGKRLPTEAEWEFAARGGLSEKKFIWGDSMKADGKWMMNIWQGDFPAKNSAEDGFPGLAPVKSFPANGYGLHDMAGNVWEWTADWYDSNYYAISPEYNPKGAAPSADNHQGQPSKLMRGGSWLCNDCYCEGYRPAARQFTTPDTASNHLGFRCVK